MKKYLLVQTGSFVYGPVMQFAVQVDSPAEAVKIIQKRSYNPWRSGRYALGKLKSNGHYGDLPTDQYNSWIARLKKIDIDTDGHPERKSRDKIDNRITLALHRSGTYFENSESPLEANISIGVLGMLQSDLNIGDFEAAKQRLNRLLEKYWEQKKIRDK